jgi:hypothetical protein
LMKMRNPITTTAIMNNILFHICYALHSSGTVFIFLSIIGCSNPCN